MTDDFKQKRVVITVEARMTSSRLPGKVLMTACGKTMLELLIERLRRVDCAHDIVIATTTNKEDDPIVSLCQNLGCSYYRGSEEDVLKRVFEAAVEHKADVICEITADCPLIDPQIISHAISTYLENDVDYLSNCQTRRNADLDHHTYPVGMDVEVFSTQALKIADQEARDPLDREHVSPYLIRSKIFRWMVLLAPEEFYYPDLELTLDEKEDYELIKKIFEELYPKNPVFGLKEILDLLSEKPKWKTINQNVTRKQHIFHHV